MDSITKNEIVKSSLKQEREEVPLKRVQVNLTTLQQKTLPDFVSKRSRNLLSILSIPDGFLVEDPDSWNSRDDFRTEEAIVNSQAVTNDHIEREVASIQDAIKSVRFKSEEHLQYGLHVI